MIKISRDSRILRNNIQEWNNVTTIHWELFIAILVVALIGSVAIYYTLKRKQDCNKDYKAIVMGTLGFFNLAVLFIFLATMFCQISFPYQDFLFNPNFDESYLATSFNSIYNIESTTPQQMAECNRISLHKLPKIKREQKQVPIIRKYQSKSKKLAQKYLRQRNQSIYTKDWHLNDKKYQYYHKMTNSDKIGKYKANIKTFYKFLKERPPHIIY